MWVNARYSRHGKWKCEKGWYNAVQRVETLLVNKNESTTAVFTTCSEHHGKAWNRDLGFTSAG